MSGTQLSVLLPLDLRDVEGEECAFHFAGKQFSCGRTILTKLLKTDNHYNLENCYVD